MARCSKISTAVPHLALGSSAIVSAGLGTNFRCLSSVLSGDQMAFISGKILWRRGSLNWSFCTFVSRFPAVVSGANGRVPPTALRLFLSSAVVWNKWLLLEKSFFGGFSQLFCTFCSPFSLLDSMLCFF